MLQHCDCRHQTPPQLFSNHRNSRRSGHVKYFHSSFVLITLMFWYAITCGECGWIDPDTHEKHLKASSMIDSRSYNLVFSDEFNVPGRKFTDGSDPRWTAIQKNDYTNFALHYYNADLVTTDSRGYLNISTVIDDISFKVKKTNLDGSVGTDTMTKNYQSGMVQGWNKFCFTGGIVELSAKLPGKWDIGGMWPAIWLLGNLVRATYVGSSNNVWPWSFDTCDSDLQSQQLFSACNRINHFGLNPKQGRGAPEIDIFEAMSGKEKLMNTPINKPYLSTSFQVAPAIQDYRPVTSQPVDAPELWYNHGIEYAGNTSLNIFFYGMNLEGTTKERSYVADAVSANSDLTASFFEELHKYRLEWQPGEEGYIRWYIDDEFRFGIDASALNITGAIIPEEPMYLIINNAISSTWGFPVPCPDGCPCDCFDCRKDECLCAVPPKMIESFPTSFLIDYVRVYQADNDDSQFVGCSTKEHPSKDYIKAHSSIYMDEGQAGKVPLRPVAKGGTSCTSHGDCGFGTCDSSSKCICNEGRTGPSCLAHDGFNDINYDPDPNDLELFLMTIPRSLLVFLFLLTTTLIAIFLYSYQYNSKQRGTWRLNSSTDQFPDSSSHLNVHGSNGFSYQSIASQDAAVAEFDMLSKDTSKLSYQQKPFL